jgi:hypothetical protein
MTGGKVVGGLYLRLEFGLVDGSDHYAKFQFVK